MTIEEYLDCSAAKLKSFTQAQLEEWFSPMLKVTRPELAEKERESNSESSNIKQLGFKSMPIDPTIVKKQQAALDIAKSLGIDLGPLTKRKKK